MKTRAVTRSSSKGNLIAPRELHPRKPPREERRHETKLVRFAQMLWRKLDRGIDAAERVRIETQRCWSASI